MEHGALSSASSFTHNGQFFALVSVDGRLRVWETDSGKLIQEFSPSAQVESSCTCLCWTRERDEKDKKNQRKNRRKTQTTKKKQDATFQPIIIGTSGGLVISYDPVAGEIENEYVQGHSQTVNCVKYSSTKDNIYSCSNDRHIVEWSYQTKEVISKWKADKVSVQLICLGPNEETLLSAGQSIKLWDLQTKQLLQKFHGHSSKVSILQFPSFSSKFENPMNDSDGHYFVSGAQHDRIINVWHVNMSKPEKASIASYMLSDVPLFLCSSVNEESEKPLKVAVGCKDGRIHYFENTLNGKTNRPLENSKIYEMQVKEGKSSNATAASFLGATFKAEESTVTLVFGTTIRPLFKLIEFQKLDKYSKVVDEICNNILLNEHVSDSDNTVEVANQKDQVKLIGSTNLLPRLSSKPDVVIDVNGNEDLDGKISMQERLEKVTPQFTKRLKPTRSNPDATSFSQMLIQSLHSNDDVLLNEILFKSYSTVVLQNTICRIPTNLVSRFVTIIVEKLQRNPGRSKDLSPWLRIMMSSHLTSIITNDKLTGCLTNLYRLLKSQQDIHPLLLNVQGKIDLLFSHAANTNPSSSDDEEGTTSAIVFHDDSEDEGESLFGRMHQSEDEDAIAEHDEDKNEDGSNDEEDNEDFEDGDDLGGNELNNSEDDGDAGESDQF